MYERVFGVGFGPGLDSISPARSRRSASHAAGTHGWLPKKLSGRASGEAGVGGYKLHSPPPPDCGTPTTKQAVSVWCHRSISSSSSVYSPFSDRVGLPPHNTSFPGVLIMKSIGVAFL